MAESIRGVAAMLFLAACSANPAPRLTAPAADSGAISSGVETSTLRDEDAGSTSARSCDYAKLGFDGGLAACKPDPTGRLGENLDRVRAVTCPEALGSRERCSSPVTQGACVADSECLHNGRCVRGHCECAVECVEDAECGPGRACQCPVVLAGQVLSRAEAGNRCVPALCRGPADCAPFACGVSVDGCGQIDGFYCRTEADECQLNSDCPPPYYCRYSSQHSKWTCESPNDCDQ